MRKLLFILLVLVSVVSYAQEPESLAYNTQSYVNDFGGIFTESEQQELDGIIRSFHNTVQISLVTVQSLNGIPRAEYATRIGNKWGVGSHSDNGLIILICKPEKQFFAATGNGIQGELTDLACAHYYDEIAKPLFRQGKFFEGTRDVMNKYIQILTPAAPEYQQKQEVAEAEHEQKQTDNALEGIGYFIFALLAFGGIFIGIRVSIKKKEQKERIEREKKEEEAREFARTKEKYYVCQSELKKLFKTLETTIFREDVDKIKLVAQGLEIKPFVGDPEKWEMDEYINRYNIAIKGVKPMIDEIDRKTNILENGKKTILNDKEFVVKCKPEIDSYQQDLLQLKFDNSGCIRFIEELRQYSISVEEAVQELEKACNEVNIQMITSISSRINNLKSRYTTIIQQLSSVIKNDNEKISVAKSGKSTLIKQIERYSSFIGKQGVSYGTNNSTNENCTNLLRDINRRFTGDVVNDYMVYNEILKNIHICGLAEKEYNAEQDRLRRIREEEERKRREEEARLRRIREEEEERIRAEQRRLQRIADEAYAAQQAAEASRRAAEESSRSSWSSSSNDSTNYGGGSFNGGGGGGEW